MRNQRNRHVDAEDHGVTEVKSVNRIGKVFISQWRRDKIT